MNGHPFWMYTRQVLDFRLGQGDGGYATVTARPEALGPMLRQAQRAGHILLLGLGTGRLAAELAEVLPPEVGLTVCDLSPDHARSLALPWWSPHCRAQLLADASPTALASLLLAAGLSSGRVACALNPEVADPTARAGLKILRTLWSAFAPAMLPQPAGLPGRSPASAPKGVDSQSKPENFAAVAVASIQREPGECPRISVAAILHPQEPDLEVFFAAVPAWASEVVAVWDSERVPERLPPCGVPVRHLAHPLNGDFAAQRNRMLAACQGDWVLYLDGDERLSPELAALLPAVLDWSTIEGVQAWAFARHGLTRNLCQGESGVKMGYGLWPDLQTRLFRRLPQVRFVRPVHERLEGLSGPLGVVLGAPILHLSDLLKDAAALERKLAVFDAAGGRGGVHRLNAAYPALPGSYFAALSPQPLAGLWPESIRI